MDSDEKVFMKMVADNLSKMVDVMNFLRMGIESLNEKVDDISLFLKNQYK
jgi:hypothetical protein